MTDDSTPQGDDLLAAELVLGLLEGEEQRRALARSRSDPVFAVLVADWQERLVSLTEEIAPAAPRTHVKKQLLKRLFQTQPVPLSQRLWVWKGLTFAALVLAGYLGGQQLGPDPRLTGRALLATQLSSEEIPLQVLAVFDPIRGDVALNRRIGVEVAGRAFELWAIVPEAAPVSLGVLAADETSRVALPPALRARASEVTLAISDEPAGGSPTGVPTGAILAASAWTEL